MAAREGGDGLYECAHLIAQVDLQPGGSRERDLRFGHGAALDANLAPRWRRRLSQAQGGGQGNGQEKGNQTA
jgi:hypothetical protein